MERENKTQSMLEHQLLDFMPREGILVNEPMKRHTTFKIGGPADFLLLPTEVEQIQKILEIGKTHQVPVFVMGNGSNLLVSDKGIRAIVIKIAQNFNQVQFHETSVVAQAGVLLSSLAKKILERCLGGFEFAAGIPGTLGGAVTMNAGAYGGEMKDVVRSCRVMDQNGEIFTLTIDQLEMGYRTSRIQKKGYVLLESELVLSPDDYQPIKERMDDLNQQRTQKQPLHLPSAGSVFKRPTGYFAGKLIQDCGLKGVKVGGAQVSELHSGFIVNVEDATAADVLNLIQLIQSEVRKKFQVELETEIRIIGEE